MGTYKTISRKHAIISYNFKKKCFEITCLSKNGMKISNQLFTHKSVPQPLNHGSEVQLGDSYFIFLLPKDTIQFHLDPIFEEENEEEIKKRKQKNTIESSSLTSSNNSSIISKNQIPFEKPTESYSTMM